MNITKMGTLISSPQSFTLEYALLAVLVLLLFLEKSVKQVTKRLKHGDEISVLDNNNEEFNNLPGPPHLPLIGAIHYMLDMRRKLNAAANKNLYFQNKYITLRYFQYLSLNTETINILKKFARLYGPVAKFKLFFRNLLY